MPKPIVTGLNQSIQIYAGPALRQAQIISKYVDREVTVELSHEAALELHFQLGELLKSGLV